MDKALLTFFTDNLTPVKLVATVKPDEAENKELVWSSSDPSVAEVAQDGTVTPKKVGNTDITAKTTDGGERQDVCKVSVSPRPTFTEADLVGNWVSTKFLAKVINSKWQDFSDQTAYLTFKAGKTGHVKMTGTLINFDKDGTWKVEDGTIKVTAHDIDIALKVTAFSATSVSGVGLIRGVPVQVTFTKQP